METEMVSLLEGLAVSDILERSLQMLSGDSLRPRQLFKYSTSTSSVRDDRLGVILVWLLWSDRTLTGSTVKGSYHIKCQLRRISPGTDQEKETKCYTNLAVD
jgi:hypothetical protein